ncbi:PGPGW domain-containing protein [Tessaracoccus sp.]
MARKASKRRATLAVAKRLVIEITGFLLLLVGVAALVLPGPGLLFIAAGLALLSTQYAWADRLLHPLKDRAFHLAAEGVQTWPRIAMSVLGGLSLVTMGILWGMDFPVPTWWPIDARWWLFGGWTTGLTLMSSGALALGLIIYSYRRFSPRRIHRHRRV